MSTQRQDSRLLAHMSKASKELQMCVLLTWADLCCELHRTCALGFHVVVVNLELIDCRFPSLRLREVLSMEREVVLRTRFSRCVHTSTTGCAATLVAVRMQ